MASVRLRGVTKRFGSVTAVADVNLNIANGEFFVLLGPTGAGKTTTLRCIAGLEKPEAGSIYIDNVSVNLLIPAQRDVAFVFQYYSLYPMYTVRQNLEFPLHSRIHNYTEDQIQSRVRETARILHIEHLLDRGTEKLSGGEMQRVSIGRAIVRRPKVFLMDEPLSNLDAKLREELRGELKRLQLELDATFFYVTHDQTEALTMADRIGVLKNGKVLQIASPSDIYEHPKNIFVASFVGSPSISLFDATLEGKRIHIKERFSIQLGNDQQHKLKGFQGKMKIGIRPEDVQISSDRIDNGGEATIYSIENMGMEKIVTLKLQDIRMKAIAGPEFKMAIDSPVHISCNTQKLHFFDANSGENLLKV